MCFPNAKKKGTRAMTTRKRELIDDEAAIGLPLLGYTTLFHLKDIEIDQPSILRIISPLGLEKFLPGLPEPQTALKRAVSRWMKQLAKVDLGIDEEDKTLVRPINLRGKSPILAMALIVESKDLEEWGLSYLTNLRVFYDKASGTLALTCTSLGQGTTMTPMEQQLIASLDPLFRYFQQVYVATDLGRMVARAILDMDSTTLREKGGAYFVPYKRREDLQALKDMLELGLPAPAGKDNTSTISAFPVIDKNSMRKQMSQLSHKSMMAEIEAMSKDLDRFIEKAKSITEKGNPGRVKKQSIVSRLTEYKGMKQKIELYSEMLGLRKEELMESLGTLKEKAMELVDLEAEEV